MKNELSRREFLGNAAAGVGALALPGFAAAAEAKKPRNQILAARLDLGTRYEQVEKTGAYAWMSAAGEVEEFVKPAEEA